MKWQGNHIAKIVEVKYKFNNFLTFYFAAFAFTTFITISLSHQSFCELFGIVLLLCK